MKFSKKLQEKADPRYKENYIAYKELKKVIKLITGQDTSTYTIKEVTTNFGNIRALSGREYKSSESRFCDILNVELEKINKFCLNIIKNWFKEIENYYYKLKDKNEYPYLDLQNIENKLNEFGDVLIFLENYKNLNFTGFCKITKKFDKHNNKKVSSSFYLSDVLNSFFMQYDINFLVCILSICYKYFRIVKDVRYSITMSTRDINMEKAENIEIPERESKMRETELDDDIKNTKYIVELQNIINVKIELAKHFVFEYYNIKEQEYFPSIKKLIEIISINKIENYIVTIYLDDPMLNTFNTFVNKNDTTTNNKIIRVRGYHYINGKYVNIKTFVQTSDLYEPSHNINEKNIYSSNNNLLNYVNVNIKNINNLHNLKEIKNFKKSIQEDNELEYNGQGQKESGKEKSGKEKSGEEESGKEESGKEESGKEESGEEESGKEESGKEESGKEESGEEESGKEEKGEKKNGIIKKKQKKNNSEYHIITTSDCIIETEQNKYDYDKNNLNKKKSTNNKNCDHDALKSLNECITEIKKKKLKSYLKSKLKRLYVSNKYTTGYIDENIRYWAHTDKKNIYSDNEIDDEKEEKDGIYNGDVETCEVNNQSSYSDNSSQSEQPSQPSYYEEVSQGWHSNQDESIQIKKCNIHNKSIKSNKKEQSDKTNKINKTNNLRNKTNNLRNKTNNLRSKTNNLQNKKYCYFNYAIFDISTKKTNTYNNLIAKLNNLGIMTEVWGFSSFLEGISLIYPQNITTYPHWHFYTFSNLIQFENNKKKKKKTGKNDRRNNKHYNGHNGCSGCSDNDNYQISHTKCNNSDNIKLNLNNNLKSMNFNIIKSDDCKNSITYTGASARIAHASELIFRDEIKKKNYSFHSIDNEIYENNSNKVKSRNNNNNNNSNNSNNSNNNNNNISCSINLKKKNAYNTFYNSKNQSHSFSNTNRKNLININKKLIGYNKNLCEPLLLEMDERKKKCSYNKNNASNNSSNNRSNNSSNNNKNTFFTFLKNSIFKKKKNIHDSSSTNTKTVSNTYNTDNIFIKKIPKNTVVRVDPKTFFANERTLLQWLNTSVLLSTISITLLNFSNYYGFISGIIMAPVAIFFIIYSFYVYLKRSKALAEKEPINYTDKVGPGILVITLTFALTTVVILNVYSHWQQSI
ncbi:SPX domain/Domain of unknown function (DUF202), putative [Hepatocystis sp. ex Piliocolobus tephrosceles]|nr:SPX domain/Domain of unknown function (DUF202), putative [Hepatocystis sp. ex Piliocolobus tephrosceles]